MSAGLYPYSEGDRLADRNTYFYSIYGGEAFLQSYFDSRQAALKNLGTPIPPEQLSKTNPQGVTAEGIDTRLLIQSLLAMYQNDCMTSEGIDLVSRLVQRFEVSKRIYPRYNANWRADDLGDYMHLDLYLMYGYLMVEAYATTASLTRLNVLLKLVDSLISVQTQLNSKQRGALAWLVEKETEYVKTLCDSLELEI